ncbi:MAG: SMC-Scp complex subunit ScpB, partial [Tissierellaceae bacterium]
EKKLVQELGRLDKIGRPIVYGTTDEFLRLFSLESLDDLPDFQEMVVRIDEEFNEYEE